MSATKEEKSHKNSHRNSLETILTFDNSSLSIDNWSVAWSTEHVPGMDNAAGGRRARRGGFGRRRLWYGSFALGALLTMHIRVSVAMLTGGFFLYTVFTVVIFAGLANPMRHFEIFLGQWSLSGPGRAFRIVPMLDGIGIAICINAIIRAICCICIAAITCVYLIHTIADRRLPYTYCRDTNLTKYEPEDKPVNILRTKPLLPIFILLAPFAVYIYEISFVPLDHLVRYHIRNCRRPGFRSFCIRTKSGSVDFSSMQLLQGKYEFRVLFSESNEKNMTKMSETPVTSTEMTVWTNKSGTNKKYIFEMNSNFQMKTCKEIYSTSPLHRTPAYNFFFVEVMLYKPDYYFGNFNLKLAIALVILWSFVWAGMIFERIRNGRLIWNNTPRYLIVIPCLWCLLILGTGSIHLLVRNIPAFKVFLPGSSDIVGGLTQAVSAAMYVHSASFGTELIYGKGLNHYASGHIDPLLNGENVLHSSLLLALTLVHASGAAVCAVVDNYQPDDQLSLYGLRPSTLWMIPMYSKCLAIGRYSHLQSTLVIGGLTLSYTVVAYMLLKSALHTIFEYRVKLVFVEQGIVAGLILVCMLLSLLIATNGGLRLLESVEDIMTGLAISYVCCIQLVAFIYAYRSHDFMSDINIATEENTCSTRITTQWKVIPIITLLWFTSELVHQFYPHMPYPIVFIAIIPFVGILLAVPIRAAVNAYIFLRPAPRRGT